MNNDENVAVARSIMAGGDRPERSDGFTVEDDRWVNFSLAMFEGDPWTILDRKDDARAMAACELMGGTANFESVAPDPRNPTKMLPAML